MATDTIEREISIEAPIERVWALITEAEHVGTWFGDAGAVIDLRPGGEFTMTWTEHGTTRGRVEIVEPHTRFAYRWSSVKGLWGDEPTEANSTLVEFTLESVGSATKVRLVESGFASLDVSEELRVDAHAGNTRGWKAELGDLEAYAASVAA